MLFGSIWKDLKWHLKFGVPLTKIIYANVFVFLLLSFLNVIDFFSKLHTSTWLLEHLSFFPSRQFFFQPWGILTYQFTHIGFMHILFNMLWLYWFGMIVQDFIGRNKIVPLYLFGGFFGAVFFALITNLIQLADPNFNLNGSMHGASAGVMAIVWAAATLSPNYEIRLLLLGNIKLKWIALAILVLDIIMLNDGNFGGHIAHIGGAFFGWLYITLLRNGNDLTHPFYDVIDFFKSIFKKKEKMKVVYRKPQQQQKVYAGQEKKQQTNKKESEFSELNKREKQEKLDNILDKINSSGYDSLTSAEKEFLFKISKED
ncbi:MAG: rhomboid family intramembrane serine protease [Chitinophagales bacterium]|nr:rhomboid family intramembrane serine protease [Chitinophagales bacterium]